MKEKVAEQTTKLKKEFEIFNKLDWSILDEHLDKLNIIETTLVDHKDKWVGKWYSQNFDVYLELSGKEDKRYKYTFDGIRKHIGKLVHIDIVELLNNVDTVLEKFIEFNDNLITELSILNDIDGFEIELEQYNKLKNYEWKESPRKLIDKIRPKVGGYSWDQLGGVLGRFNTPPHIELAAQIWSMILLNESIREYPKSVKRLIRQLEIKTGVVNPNSYDGIATLNELCTRFHKVAIQLKNRYDNRNTIQIEDEYDVQDLMHALLKSRFDDIRPEEYSPSYAGKNTRIDFLLKKEKILIEIKKTRESLKDDKIGSELILDISRYKGHPDCETLYCFVYDPQSHISNPIGLENDLMKNSTQDFKVIVKIAP